jgi:hypothetical protein
MQYANILIYCLHKEEGVFADLINIQSELENTYSLSLKLKESR